MFKVLTADNGFAGNTFNTAEFIFFPRDLLSRYTSVTSVLAIKKWEMGNLPLSS